MVALKKKDEDSDESEEEEDDEKQEDDAEKKAKKKSGKQVIEFLVNAFCICIIWRVWVFPPYISPGMELPQLFQ